MAKHKKKKEPKEPEKTPPKPPPLNRPFSGLGALRDKLAKEEPAGTREAKTYKTLPPPKPVAQTEDDALSFHRMMGGVTPLEEKAARVPVSKHALRDAPERAANLRSEGLKRAESEADAVHEHLRNLVEGGTRFEVADDGRRVEGRRVEVPQEVLRKLRRGVLPIDARLDLHGFGAQEARDKLEVFLREKRAMGERCVLVIHGKGEHSPGRTPVLRGEIAAWLSQGRGGEHVAAFATARDGDGGEGAVYVLLKR